MTDIPSTIARVLELDAAGTPEPWVQQRSESVNEVVGPDRVICDDAMCYPAAVGVEDQRLIAYYRTAAPLLARECERLRAALDLATIEDRMLDEAEADDRELAPEDVAAAEIAEEEFQAWKRERDSRNPSAVAALIADRDAARAEVERLRKLLKEGVDIVGSYAPGFTVWLDVAGRATEVPLASGKEGA